jgi:large conductance mechanosensitive channel
LERNHIKKQFDIIEAVSLTTMLRGTGINMSILKELKTFILRGSMVDLAVGVVIGAAFGKVINSLVNDILMPPLGLIIGGVDFSKLRLSLGRPDVTINYGAFINTLVDFVIVACAIFFFIKLVNALRSLEQAQPVLQKNCPECAMNIPISAKRCGHCTCVL